MLPRFPPIPVDRNDPSFLYGKKDAFAKLKIEYKAGKRTVFLTEHTLIFVLKGIKLLHFSDKTVEVGPDNIILLKKGIYVMAEHIEAGLSFEALMLFLPTKVFKSFAGSELLTRAVAQPDRACMVFPTGDLVHKFKEQIRHYFTTPHIDFEPLLTLKQQEILLILAASGHQVQIAEFIKSALSAEPEELDYTVRTYLFQPVSIEELARLANRSLASFKRDFQAIYQSPPRKWINQKKIEHAWMLLHNTNKRISEIAQDCGFESTSYFIRLFKQIHGCTPQSLRAESAMN